MNTAYERIIGAQTVEWEGRELTLTQLRMVLFETDRSRREAAWRKTLARQLADRENINRLWQQMLKLRFRLARNAGLPGFCDYRWQQMLRFDYTPENCRTFQQAIEQTAVPAARRIYERRRRRLGVETLRPWDLEADLLNRPPLRPFTKIDELRDGTMAIARNVSPIVRRMPGDNGEGRSARPGEPEEQGALAHTVTTYQAAKRPFMFLNAVGTAEDIRTLLHEGGHASCLRDREAALHAAALGRTRIRRSRLDGHGTTGPAVDE